MLLPMNARKERDGRGRTGGGIEDDGNSLEPHEERQVSGLTAQLGDGDECVMPTSDGCTRPQMMRAADMAGSPNWTDLHDVLY